MQQCWPNQVGCLAARDPPMAVTSAHAHGMSKGLSTQCLRIGAAFVQDIIHTHMLWWERKCGRSLVKNLDRPLSWHKGYDYIICISSLFFIISIFQLFFNVIIPLRYLAFAAIRHVLSTPKACSVLLTSCLRTKIVTIWSVHADSVPWLH